MRLDFKEVDSTLMSQAHVTKNAPQISIVKLAGYSFIVVMGLEHLNTVQDGRAVCCDLDGAGCYVHCRHRCVDFCALGRAILTRQGTATV